MTKKRAGTALAAVTALVAGLLTMVLGAPAASAHGALMKAGSRTFLCWQDGLTPQGNIVPINPACSAAVNQSGANSLYNWFSVLRSDGAGRTRGFIPDGQLCSGGNPSFAGFNVTGNWPLTHLTSGANFNFSYNAWAAHPGWFYLYVTKDGWNPNAPLRWDDLEDQPFLTVDHPQVTGPVGNVEGQYKWSGALPSGKSGRHLIYSVWKRSDSAETFYGCSDVTFDGGNGEVTGVKDSTGTQPGTGSCLAEYAVTGTWDGGHQAEVTVKNQGTAPLSGWRANWTLPAGQTINSVWNGTQTQTGDQVTVRNVEWNAGVAANGSAKFGLSVNSPGGSPTVPAVTCQSP
ncbi:lytic polysaccharide monooxygenase [Amycolatopsis sp. YIM 10]|uniref:lytic polysaccharide monooxygenase auxiliary activity family 9 protein n=1 Tax=Amycolatopsis sp. YIM 10 TaxID=2653857 RepID=UPI0012A78C5E|nr:lytic polysaccharide monooxygenase [Amycolatopsis sp. YIM 10]QFU89137.1 Endo-1,4-beta-xylanase A precursor [Amycolatopsis sp. YIM 10]